MPEPAPPAGSSHHLNIQTLSAWWAKTRTAWASHRCRHGGPWPVYVALVIKPNSARPFHERDGFSRTLSHQNEYFASPGKYEEHRVCPTVAIADTTSYPNTTAIPPMNEPGTRPLPNLNSAAPLPLLVTPA